MKKKIRIAQVGTAHDHASVTYAALRKLSDDFEVVGIAEPIEKHQKNLDTVAAYQGTPHYTVEELLNMDLDAVTIEIEECYATEYAQMFAEKGIAVQLDKPGSPGIDNFVKLVETCRKQNLPLQLGYMYRFNPMIRRAIDEAKKGTIGEVYSVEAHMSVHHAIPKRTWLGGYKGGMMYWLGCHLVDLVYRIQGEPEEVIPMNCQSPMSRDDNVDTEDFGFAVLKYKNGVSTIKTSAAEFNGFARRQLVISGTKGTIEVYPLETGSPTGKGTVSYARFTTKDHEQSPFRDCSERWECEPFERYDNMLLHFAKLVRRECENPYDYDYEIAMFKLFTKCCGGEKR